MCQQVQNLVKKWEEEALQKIACTGVMQAVCPVCAVLWLPQGTLVAGGGGSISPAHSRCSDSIC